jgi:methyl-accepting chemotaxis protein
MSFNDLSISKKLMTGFAGVVAVVFVMCGVLFVSMNQVTQASKMNDDSYDMVDRADQAVGDHWKMAWAFKSYGLTQEDRHLQAFQAARDEFGKDMGEARKFANGDADVERLVDQMKVTGEAYDDYADGAMRLLRDPATRDQGMTALRNPESARRTAAFEAATTELLQYANKWSDGWTAKEDGALATSRLTLILGGSVSLLISALMGWVLTRSIARPVSQMTGAMNRLADGDHAVEVPAVGRGDEVGQMAAAVQTFKAAAIEKLRLEGVAEEQRRVAEIERGKGETERAETARRQAEVVSSLAQGLEKLSAGVLTFRLDQAFAAEYEKLRADFNAAMQQLQETMKIVAANTAGIRSGTGEITQASDDLSRRTEQQAASLEETAAALDQITATVRKTAQGANEAREVVSAAKTDAEHSGAVVKDAVAAMSEIESSSRQISQIIGVIDEIAFQTNLLALNAGVEAARAGDAGKGFAVVASEVRALAQRSAEAAKEIKALISSSSQQVGRGVNLVGETGQALERIVAQVTQINGVVAEIAASAQEQAVGLAQVNTAVNQMDQVTQQNAAMVEQSTAASHALAQETEELSRLIGRFEVGEPARVEQIRGRPRPVSSSHAPRPALKTTSQRSGGGALARAPEPDGWDEF